MHLKKKKRNWLWIVLALLLIAAAMVVFYLLWERPPEIPAATPEPTPAPTPTPTAAPTPTPTPTPEPMPEGSAYDTGRQDGMYTLLLVGLDQMSGSTDTILVCRLDTVKHEINAVSIPRDTLINVDSDIRKLNSVYMGSINWGGTGIDSLTTQIRWLTGFEPDCYAVMDLNTFIDVIDELGGVDFYVPEEMEYMYDDISDRLYVYLAPGMQHLDGIHAMALCRYRVGYISGDYGRMDVQHEFLKACADQFITLKNIPHARAVAEILAENLNTNLTAGNIAWFMRQLLQCNSLDIHFYTMPSEGRLLQGYSYAVVNLYEWLDMLNSCLNPYDRELGIMDLNAVYTVWGGGYAGTQGYLDGDWYFMTEED